MEGHYGQLSLEERCTIARLHEAGLRSAQDDGVFGWWALFTRTDDDEVVMNGAPEGSGTVGLGKVSAKECRRGAEHFVRSGVCTG